MKVDNRSYKALLAEMQRLRGDAYLSDGAIQQGDLTPDGRHVLAIDEQSWHVLALNPLGQVCGCVRYLEEKTPTSFEDLWIHESALARCPTWGERFRRAVEQEMTRARRKRVAFAEVGGWAVAQDRRGTPDSLRMILAVWGLAQMIGGGAGVATATVRHHSAFMLRRIGLRSMTENGVELPAYYDPYYGCEMQALCFDSDLPNPKYRRWIEELRRDLETAQTVAGEGASAPWRGTAPELVGPMLNPQPMAAFLPAPS